MAEDTTITEPPAIVSQDGSFAEGWTNVLPEDLRDNETIKTAKTLGDMAKMTIEAQKLVGSSVRIPNPDAPDEEKREFYKKLGCPETAEAYVQPELELPEGLPYDEEAAKLLTGFCHKLGISQTQYEQLYKYYNDFQAKKYGEIQQVSQAATEKAQTELKQKWGESDYDKNVEVARRALQKFATDEQTKFLEEAEVGGVKLGNHPVLVEMFNTIGQKMSDDSLIKGGSPATGAEAPDYPNSPGMYADDPKWRPWFEARGHKFTK